VVVRVRRRGIEWSLPDDGTDIEVIPMASVIEVMSEPGRFWSTLIVRAEQRNVEFRVDNDCAMDARALIRLLIAVFGPEPAPHVSMPAAS
jgi:hypothetical protein